jgi:hypothetical protein
MSGLEAKVSNLFCTARVGSWPWRKHGGRLARPVAGAHLPRRSSDWWMSFGALCLVLFAMFAFVININVPDIQFVQSDLLAGL